MILVFSLLNFSTSYALSSEAKSLFEQGTQAYLKADYSTAKELLNKSMQLEPTNSQILTNLGMTEFRLQNIPLAIGLLRKAITLEPGLDPARNALKFVISQHPIREIPHQTSTYESFRANLLNPMSLSSFLTLSLLTFFAAGWLLIRWMGQKRRSLEEEKAPPPFPWVSAVLSLAFVLFTLLATAKYIDSLEIRGTVIEAQVSLQMAPGENQALITEIYGGSEVIVRQIQNEWAQITYPGASSGWVKTSSLLMTR